MITSATASFRRLGLLAAGLLVLVQVAVIGHAVAADHETGEACVVCLASDRIDEVGATPAAIETPAPAAHVAAVTPTRTANDDHRPGVHRARGPPSL